MSEAGEGIAILILAAGSSSRLGQSKQLVRLGDSTLLERTIDAALEVSSQAVVVLGAEFNKHAVTIQSKKISVTHNHGWAEGMGSSIRIGMESLLTLYPDTAAVLICVCDQPHLGANHLHKLVQRWKSEKESMVASRYNEQPGVPALFPRSQFAALLQLPSDSGARSLLRKAAVPVQSVDFPDGAVDVDTPDDLQRLQGIR